MLRLRETSAALLCLCIGFDGQLPPIHNPDLIRDVTFAGCTEVLVGPICELNEDAELTLWIQSLAQASLSVEVDGTNVDARWVEVDGGLQTVLRLAQTARKVVVRASHRSGGRDTFSTYRLPITNWQKPPVVTVATSFISRNATVAFGLAEALAHHPDLRVQSEAETIKGKVLLRDNKPARAAHHRRLAAQLGQQAGLLKKPYWDLSTVAWVAVKEFDAATARLVLDEMAEMPHSHYGFPLRLYYEGVLANLTGDIRAAERQLGQAEILARRIRLPLIEMGAALTRATILTSLGRFKDAFRAYERLRAPSDECRTAYILGSKAWAGIMSKDVGIEAPFDVEHAAQRSIALFEQCDQRFQIPDVLATLAMARIQKGDPFGARKIIAEARSYPHLSAYVRWSLVDASARAAMLEHNYVAAKAEYEQLKHIATRRGLPTAGWRAVVGIAKVSQAAGDLQSALLAYAEAERQLDTVGAQSLFMSTLASLTSEQQRAARHHASLLLATGQPREAIAVLQRQARRRLLGISRAVRVAALPPERRKAWNEAALAYAKLREEGDRLDGQRWGEAPSTAVETAREAAKIRLSIQEALDKAFRAFGPEPPMPTDLPEFPADEVLLGYDQVVDGWLGFAVDSKDISIARVALDPAAKSPEELSQILLMPFAAQLRSHRSVRIAARGKLARVDFHALPFDGLPLIATHRIVYTLDSPRPAQAMGTTERRALVVADPDGTLPGARDEGQTVAQSLRRLGLATVLLAGPGLVRTQLLHEMGGHLLHWAGHSRQVGLTIDGLGSSVLPLGSASHLTAGDVLALPEVPRRVILAGCETSVAEGGNLGVAQAFILAGAEAVIATNRAVRDSDARAIGKALYDANVTDLGSALRLAQLQLRDSVSDWAAFRILVP